MWLKDENLSWRSMVSILFMLAFVLPMGSGCDSNPDGPSAPTVTSENASTADADSDAKGTAETKKRGKQANSGPRRVQFDPPS